MDKNQSPAFLISLNERMKDLIGKEVQLEVQDGKIVKGLVKDVGDFMIFWDERYSRCTSFWDIEAVKKISLKKKKEK